MAFQKNKAHKIVVKEVLYHYVVSRCLVGQVPGALSLRVRNDVRGRQMRFIAHPKAGGQDFTPQHAQDTILGKRDLNGWKILPPKGEVVVPAVQTLLRGEKGTRKRRPNG